MKCTRCGNEDEVGRFCPACGAAQEKGASVPGDAFIGMTISDRYEIVELINAGGMGRVYRAKQRMLDRDVALKVIHPHLLTTEQVVARFLVEAKTASKMNHPNVVNIYDFGRTPEAEGGHLFLVMELLSGQSLARMIEAGEHFAPIRVAHILRQVLAALGEAHHLGITHRDVKPENVLLEQRRGDSDHVKVIDFGIAMAQDGPRLSQAGQLVGTPHYMAPEIMTGKVGPSIDLYAVGVVFFEMLTGVAPFDDEAISTLLIKQATAPRPDPRTVAPTRDIPASLAQLCVRSIDADPAKRFDTAEAFAEALEFAVADVVVGRKSLPTGGTSYGATTRSNAPRPSRGAEQMPRSGDDESAQGTSQYTIHHGTPSRPPRSGATPSSPARRVSQYALRQSSVARPSPRSPAELARSEQRSEAVALMPTLFPTSTPPPRRASGDLLDRDELIGRVWNDVLARPDCAHVVWGRPGTGRSAVLKKIVDTATREGMSVVHVEGSAAPLEEIGFYGLRRILAALLAATAEDPRLTNLEIPGDVAATARWRQLFDPSVLIPLDSEGDAASMLRWAVQQARVRAGTKRVLLAIDDVDALDGASRIAIESFIDGAPLAGFTLLSTSEHSPSAGLDRRIASTEVRGVSRATAASMLRALNVAIACPRTDDAIEPLYLDLMQAWPTGSGLDVPRELDAVVEMHLLVLPASHRFVIQVLSILGPTTRTELGEVIPEVVDLEGVMSSLVAGGLIRADGGSLQLAHRIFARLALTISPPGSLAVVHRRIAALLAARPDRLELRAFHAIRAEGDDIAFLLLAQSAELRTARADIAGAVLALSDGMQVAQRQVRDGETDFEHSAWPQFAQMLANALMACDRAIDAVGILTEALEAASPRSALRAKILYQLSMVALQRGQLPEAEKWRREAMVVAELCGETTLLERLRKPGARPVTGPHRKAVFATASRSILPPAQGTTAKP